MGFSVNKHLDFSHLLVILALPNFYFRDGAYPNEIFMITINKAISIFTSRLKFNPKASLNFKMLAILSIIVLLASCSPLDKNADSDKWNNTYVWFNPNDLDMLYVSDNADIKSTTPIQNNTEYSIGWEEDGKEYKLEITSINHKIDFAWFTGYNAKSNQEEIPWIIEGNTFKLISNKLKPTEEGLYQISLSEDLSR